MSKLFEYNADDSFCLGSSIYPNSKGQSILSFSNHVDVYFPQKSSCINAPFLLKNNRTEKKLTSIEDLPDELLFEIFRRLPSHREKSACAFISRRWLMLLCNIRREEFCSKNIAVILSPSTELAQSDSDESEGIENDGHLSRKLEGARATDTRLAAIAVGSAGCGGLGKLFIRGSNHKSRVSNLGLKAIAHGCPFLRVLSIWNLSSVGDEGITEIAKGCHLLEKLDLCQCPLISDKALLPLPMNCPCLTDLTIESCSNIGNEGLHVVSQYCHKLKFITIKNCPLVGDQGIVSLFASAYCALTKIKLHAINITDVSLAVIGHYGKVVTDLVLSSLHNVTERGFWVMGSSHGLRKMTRLAVESCPGMTDVGLEAFGKNCSNLKQLFLCKCAFLSDTGLVSFVRFARSLKMLHLKECHRITPYGVFVALVCVNLNSLALENCLGIVDTALELRSLSSCRSLHSLSINGCPGFSDSMLAMLGKICPQVQCLKLWGLHGITDLGLLSLVENLESSLLRVVDLSNCVNITDAAILHIVRSHGGTLDTLNLDGCSKITDSTLMAIAEHCLLLSNLDISRCEITDSGIAALACAENELELDILSLSGCQFVTDKSFFPFVRLGRMLSGLNLQHCSGISSSKVNLLVEELWGCSILT